MPLPRQIVLAVRIDHGDARGQLAANLVMVDDDDVGACARRSGNRLGGIGAAIDRNDQAGARRQFAHGVGIGAIALEDPVGNVDFDLNAEMPEIALHDR